MANYTLPFYNEFFHVLENHEIDEWRANDFIHAIFPNKININIHEKQNIYRGLNVLVKCNYLSRVKDKINKNIFRYNETNRLKSYKMNKKILKIKEVLLEEKNNLDTSLRKRNSEKIFIKDILSKNPNLEDFFKKYDLMISKELSDLENKNIFIKNIFDDLEKNL